MCVQSGDYSKNTVGYTMRRQQDGDTADLGQENSCSLNFYLSIVTMIKELLWLTLQLNYDILLKIAPATAPSALVTVTHKPLTILSPVQHKAGISFLVSLSSTIAVSGSIARPQNVNVIAQTIVVVSNSASSNGHAQFDLNRQSPSESVLRATFTTGCHLLLHWACIHASAL